MFSLPLKIEREILIEKSLATVYGAIVDFSLLPKWSPWLVLEPNCPLKITGTKGEVGYMQEWDGKRIGSGQMKIVSKTEDRVDMALTFLKPWRSESTASFILTKKSENSTNVKWNMNANLPIFMFFFRKMMEAMIGNDYERGLGMLKDYLELGEVPMKMNIGEEPLPFAEFYYVGIRRNNVLVREIPHTMTDDLAKLALLLESKSLPAPKFVFSSYEKFDFVLGITTYVIGYAYDKNLDFVKDGFLSGYVPAHHGMMVDLVGSYKYLANAWSALMSTFRAGKYKGAKRIHQYEIYYNSPKDVSEKELKTRVVMPIRSSKSACC